MAGDTAQAVQALYRAYAAGDQAAVAAMIADDIDWVIYGPVAVFPFQGARHGKAAVLQVLAEIARDYVLRVYRPELVITEGDRAAVLSDVAFTQRATGRLLRMRVANFLRFSDAKLVEFREFLDSFDAVEQALGTWLELPPAPTA